MRLLTYARAGEEETWYLRKVLPENQLPAELADLRRARRGMIRRPGASGIVSRRGDCYTSYRALLSSRTPATTFQSTEFIALLPRRYARYSSYPEKWQVRNKSGQTAAR